MLRPINENSNNKMSTWKKDDNLSTLSTFNKMCIDNQTDIVCHRKVLAVFGKQKLSTIIKRCVILLQIHSKVVFLP